jgi:transposase
MGVAVTITRLEHSVPELRGMAARSADGTVACRLLAIAHVLEGASRAEAAALCGMDRQTLRDWVQRFNTEGIAGLANRTSPGRNPALSDTQMAELKGLVLAGPDLATHGVVRWRCSDLRGVIAERFGVQVHERTVGKLLRRVRLTRLQPRPHNPKRDEAAQEVFKKAFLPS